MSFQNYICWQSSTIQKVFTIEATQAEKSIFLATHHPIKMKKSESILGEDDLAYTEDEFLADFLKSDDFAFVPVLGTSGTGKSHLIRWLSAKIESTETRKVLLIPKLGTNLKDIINLILDLPELQAEKFEEYRKRVQQSSNRLSEKEAREQFLNNLAIAVGENNRLDPQNLSEEEAFLVTELPSFLYDPHFRQHWLKDGGMIHRLVIHILGYKGEIENIEERREFTRDDLPLNILDYTKAGQQVQNFYGYLLDDSDLQQITVDWLNQHLDEAITQVLNLGGEDLQILMREVRETLAEKGIELVLLIEDFAKLQGIDREVLEAVLARPQQGENKPLCAIRTALACTTGYFKGLVENFDTVKQRVTFKVNLDIESVGERSLITETDVQQFVSRYLNAVRHRESEIQNSDGELTNACDSCPHRTECHAGFGQVNGIGFYPFTAIALRNMRQRKNPDNFNPRILLKDVLKFTLEKAGEDLPRDRFPSKVLREHFGSSRLGTLPIQDINQQDKQNPERRRTLLELWTDSNTIHDLAPEIHGAFNLPRLGIEDIGPIIPPISPVSPQPIEPIPESPSAVPDSLSRKLDLLNDWNNQGILPQSIEKDLRESLYPAIVEHIAWDTELLLEKTFSGPNGIFKQRNFLIQTRKQRGKGSSYSGILLVLPLNPEDDTEFRETAIAFQAILQYNHYKHWNFPDGDRYFRIYAKYLDLWSEYILEQIDRYPRVCGEIWNPVPAVAELLALTAQFVGHPTDSLEETIDALFIPSTPIENPPQSPSWQKLAGILQKGEERLREILVSRIACTKGSSKDFQIIDTYQILEPLQDFRKHWQPREVIPDDLQSEYEVIAKVRQEVDKLLRNAIEEEFDRQFEIYQKLVSEFGEDVKNKEVVSVLRGAIKHAQNAAISGVQSLENLERSIKEFRNNEFDTYVTHMKKMQTLKEKAALYRLLPILREDYQKTMDTIESFIQESNRFLDTSLNQANNAPIELSVSDRESIDIVQEKIVNGLTDLQNLLVEIGE